MRTPQGFDFAERRAVDYVQRDELDRAIDAHNAVDTLMFSNIGKRLDNIESYLKAAMFGIVGSVGLAILQLVIKH
jgi:hypothetical protein